jgi:hypothetical protein
MKKYQAASVLMTAAISLAKMKSNVAMTVSNNHQQYQLMKMKILSVTMWQYVVMISAMSNITCYQRNIKPMKKPSYQYQYYQWRNIIQYILRSSALFGSGRRQRLASCRNIAGNIRQRNHHQHHRRSGISENQRNSISGRNGGQCWRQWRQLHRQKTRNRPIARDWRWRNVIGGGGISAAPAASASKMWHQPLTTSWRRVAEK